MKKLYLPFYAFAVLLLCSIPFSFSRFSLPFASSVVPGWHTTIYPPYFLLNLIVTGILFFACIAYRKLAKLQLTLKPWVMIAQWIMSVPVIIHLNFPSVINNILFEQGNIITLQQVLGIMLAPYFIFLLGQFPFLFYYFITIKAKPGEV